MLAAHPVTSINLAAASPLRVRYNLQLAGLALGRASDSSLPAESAATGCVFGRSDIRTNVPGRQASPNPLPVAVCPAPANV